MEFEQAEILKILNRRVTSIKRTTLFLIYLIFSIAVLGLTLGYSSNQKELSKTIHSIFNSSTLSPEEEHLQKLHDDFLSQYNEKISKTKQEHQDGSSRHILPPNNDNFNEKKVMEQLAASNDSIMKATARLAAATEFTREASTTPYSYASAIGSLIIKLTLGLFVLYIMRTVFVFIKYYMQLGNDYESQRLAYLISKGESKTFRENLEALRDNVIQMERMPKIPQEKLASEIAKVIKKETLSK
ncbi:TPA: hypothetical protein ACKPZ3_003392 [Serratia marcescens]